MSLQWCGARLHGYSAGSTGCSGSSSSGAEFLEDFAVYLAGYDGGMHLAAVEEGEAVENVALSSFEQPAVANVTVTRAISAKFFFHF